MRLSAFRHPLFALSSLPDLIRQSMRKESLIGFADEVFRSRKSAWTAGSSPAVTWCVKYRRWQNSGAKKRAARTDDLILRRSAR